MEINDKLFVTEDGIVELLNEVNIFYEEFSKVLNPSIGELEKKIFKCRCYCDFKGNPIKRDNIKIYSDLSPISKKYLRLFEKYVKNSLIEFEATRKKNKDLTRQVFLEYQTTHYEYGSLKEVFEQIKDDLKVAPFTWYEFKCTVQKYVPEVRCDEFLRYGYSFPSDPGKIVVKFRLDSINYKVKDKNSLFDALYLF